MFIIVLSVFLLSTIEAYPKLPLKPLITYVPDLPPRYSITHQLLFYDPVKTREIAINQSKLINSPINKCCALEPLKLDHNALQTRDKHISAVKQENLQKQQEKNKPPSEVVQKQEGSKEEIDIKKQGEGSNEQKLEKMPDTVDKGQQKNAEYKENQEKYANVGPQQASNQVEDVELEELVEGEEIEEIVEEQEQSGISWGQSLAVLASVVIVLVIVNYAMNYLNSPQRFAPISQSSRHQLDTNRLEID